MRRVHPMSISDFMKRLVVHVTGMMVIILTTLASPMIAQESPSSSSSPPPSESLTLYQATGQHREENGYYEIEGIGKEDYGTWNPAPRYGDGSAGPVPHPEKQDSVTTMYEAAPLP